MLNQFPKPARIAIGACCSGLSIGITIYGIATWDDISYAVTKMIVLVGALGILFGIMLIGNALGIFKD